MFQNLTLLYLAGKVREAQQKKDLELAEKIKLADEKLASVTKLEQDNTNLEAALGIANKEVSQLKTDKAALTDQVSKLTGKKTDLEAFLSSLAKKLFLMLEGKPLCLANISNCGFSIRPSP